MKPADIIFIRETFGLTQRELARALNVAPATVCRWESGSSPKGLAAQVLRGLVCVAHAVADDPARAREIGTDLALGIGALLMSLLRRELERTPARRPPAQALKHEDDEDR